MADEGGVLCAASVLPRVLVSHLPAYRAAEGFELPRAVLDLRNRLRRGFLPAEVRHGAVLKQPKRELAPAVLYELFERHSHCVLDQSGKWSLLVFTQQMCWEINEFFNGEENENTSRRRRNLPTGVAHEELEERRARSHYCRGTSAPPKQPTGTAALATLRRTLVSESPTRWTLVPIVVTDGALIRSFASLPVHHAPALPVG